MATEHVCPQCEVVFDSDDIEAYHADAKTVFCRVECYIDKEDDYKAHKEKMTAILNKDITLSGYCLGLRGLDRIVVVNTKVAE